MKHTFKRAFSLLLAFALLCTLLPQVALLASAATYSGTCGAQGDNLTWTLDTETGVLTIEGSGAMAVFEVESAPWSYYSDLITTVCLPNGLTGIGFEAFEGCSSLTSITIPDSVSYISYGAFRGCSSLTSITIPNSVTQILESAFEGCSSLLNITIPDSVTSIGLGAFNGTAYYNDETNWENGLLYLGNWLVAANSEISSANIRQGTRGIADSTFRGFSSLTSVTMPDSLSFIGFYAFNGCRSLASVTIGNGVTFIDNGAFDDTAYYHNDENWENGILYLGNWLLKAAQTIEDTEIHPGTRGIACYAFSNCSTLTSLTIPYSVNIIGSHAFQHCSSLTSIIIPDSVTSIGGYAFWGCTSLTSVTIPDSVTSIGFSTFYECTSLTSVMIPDSVTSIGNYAFCGCASLTSVIISENALRIGEMAFYRCNALTSVTIPASMTIIGSKAFGWTWSNTMQDYLQINGFTIYGYTGTAAQNYAQENDFLFIALAGFSDVKEEDYFCTPILWAINHDPQITAGVAPGYFGPHNDCTREQIVTFLWAANGKPEPAGTGEAFSDVASDAWYYKPVMWAVENGYTSGIGDGIFGVGYSCTRAQAMTFLWAAQGRPAPASTVSPFSDVTSGDWFFSPILWAYENSVTAGIGGGLFGVNNSCTRAQIITFLYKAMG